MTETVARVRLDKWLWAARFFKSRTLAAEAIDAGRARLNDERVKPAREVRAGDQVSVRVAELEWVVEVIGLSDRRGPAAAAAALFRESDESRARRELALANRRSDPQRDLRGRPTKKDRRQIQRFTQR